MSAPTEYPLCWPPGIQRHEKPGSAAFKTSLAGARENVFASLRLFGTDSGHKVTDVILSSNVTGLSGKPPADPGVAAWFMWDGEYRCIAVDRYSKVEWNLQAIHHVIEAERTKLRHGGLHIVRSTFRAYMALTGPASKRSWREVFGVPGQAPVVQEWLRSRYKHLAKLKHPDNGGNTDEMTELNVAYEQALKELAP